MNLTRKDQSLEALSDLIPIYRQFFCFLRGLDEKITFIQCLTLIALSEVNSCTMGQLSKTTQTSNQNITKIITDLETLQYVERHIDPNNRRNILVQLTKKGTNYVKTRMTEALKQVLPSYETKSEHEIKEIYEHCMALKQLLQGESQ